jgi:hypothetical protein
MAERLPVVGGDAGNWGTILNGFLQVSHAADGTLNSSVVGATQTNLPSVAGGMLLSGTFASRPAAAAANSSLYYFSTDTNGGTLFRSTGSTWVQVAAGATHGSTHSAGGPDALSGNLDATARVGVSKTGTAVGSRRTINFIEGANTTITTTDNSGSESVDVTIAAGTPQDLSVTAVPTFAGLNTNGVVTQTFQSNTNWSSGLIVQKKGNNTDINGAVLSGGEIGYHEFKAWDGTIFGRGAYVVAHAAENFATGAHGTNYSIFTTGIGEADSTERMRINGTGVHIGGADPTHTLTLPYNATGIAVYNTADQTGNYERSLASWVTNVFTIATQKGGSGTGRGIELTTANGTNLKLNDAASSSGFIQALNSTSSSTVGAIGVAVSPTWQAASGINTSLSVTPTISQSGTAGYTALHINPTESSTGSGAKTLINAQVGGSTKFSVSNTGSVTLAEGADVVAGTTTGTKIGTAATQKIGFYNTTPVVQPVGSVITALGALGLVSAPTIAATDITSGTLPIERGGTNAVTAAAARTSLAVPQASGFATITVGTTAPATPAVGDLWVDTN